MAYKFLLKVCIFFKKSYSLIKKYWQYFLGLFLVVIGYFLGRRNDNAKVIKDDLKASKQASEEKIKAIEGLTESFVEANDEIKKQHSDKLIAIEKNKVTAIDDLSNNSEKLDKILKDKFNLKKGG